LERAEAIIELQKSGRTAWDGADADRRRCVMDGLLAEIAVKNPRDGIAARAQG
jgi:hypothetical protein